MRLCCVVTCVQGFVSLPVLVLHSGRGEGGWEGMAGHRNHLLLCSSGPCLLSSSLCGHSSHQGRKGTLGRLTSHIRKLFAMGGGKSQLRPTALVVLRLETDGG